MKQEYDINILQVGLGSSHEAIGSVTFTLTAEEDPKSGDESVGVAPAVEVADLMQEIEIQPASNLRRKLSK